VMRKHSEDNRRTRPRHDGAADQPGPGDGAPVGVAFLLAQLGAHGAARFAERLTVLRLRPAHTGSSG